MTDITTTRGRGIRLVATFAAASAITVLTLAPGALVGPARGAFMRLMDAATAPLLVWVPYGQAESALNTMLFVPLGATIAMLLSRRLWPVAMLAGLALSSAVEYLQTAIPGRVPDPADVLWNTLGGAIGVVVVTAPRLIAARVGRSRQRGRATRT